jgi:hypothetical protein
MIEPLEPRRFLSTYYVAPKGSDAGDGTLAEPFKTIQHALNVAASPGDTVEVLSGTYRQRLTCTHSGSAAGGFITLEPFPGAHVLLSGEHAPSEDTGFGNNMVQIVNQSYIRVIGLEIADDSGTPVKDDATAVYVSGSGSNIQILGNDIHNITGEVLRAQDGLNTGYGGSGIQVYGSSLTDPYTDIVINGNVVYNCKPGDDSTETVTFNGNIDGFQVNNNIIHDDNNIGIAMIGGEPDAFGLNAPMPNLPQARDGVCSHNTVYHIHADYGGGYAAGIYVDGGENITVSDNVSHNNDLGLEVGSENAGVIASGVTVEDNILYRNTQAGLVFGGYDSTVGRVANCQFINNTLYQNDTLGLGNGEVWIQYASNCTVENNLIVSTNQGLIIDGDVGSANNTVDYNLFWSPDGPANAVFMRNAQEFDGFSEYQAQTPWDHDSAFANPELANPRRANFQIGPTSPAIGAGTSAAYAVQDFAGTTRHHPPDIGAYEHSLGS